MTHLLLAVDRCVQNVPLLVVGGHVLHRAMQSLGALLGSLFDQLLGALAQITEHTGLLGRLDDLVGQPHRCTILRTEPVGALDDLHEGRQQGHGGAMDERAAVGQTNASDLPVALVDTGLRVDGLAIGVDLQPEEAEEADVLGLLLLLALGLLLGLDGLAAGLERLERSALVGTHLHGDGGSGIGIGH